MTSKLRGRFALAAQTGGSLPPLASGKKLDPPELPSTPSTSTLSLHHLTSSSLPIRRRQPNLTNKPLHTFTMVKLTEVEDEHFAQDKPQASKHDILLATDDEDEDFTDTG